MGMQYWLMKSEPSCFSIDDLKRLQVSIWDDIRNYQARNFLRDDVTKGDSVLFYHSSCDAVGIVGLAEVVKEAYPDPTQFDAGSYKFDPRSTIEAPVWVSVDIRFVEKFEHPFLLTELKNDPFFDDMLVVKRGMRLSVQPVHAKHAQRIINLRSKK